MTVLRSRAIPSVPIKPQPEILKKHSDIEPVTPARTHEPTAHQSPLELGAGGEYGGTASGLDPVDGPATTRRRSLRLTSKPAGSESENFGSRVPCHGLGEEKIISGWIEDRFSVSGGNEGGKRKRRLNVDDCGVSGFEAVESKCFLSLRSGKRVAKRGVENAGADVDAVHEKTMEIANGKLDFEPQEKNLFGNVKVKAESKKKGKMVLGDMSEEGTVSEMLEKNRDVKLVKDCVSSNGKLNIEAEVNWDDKLVNVGFAVNEKSGFAHKMNTLDDTVKGKGESKKKERSLLENVSGESVVSKKSEKYESFDKPSTSRGRRKLTREEKGKGILVETVPFRNSIEKVELGVEMEVKNSFSNYVASGAVESEETTVLEVEPKKTTERNNRKNESRTELFRDIARQNASRFAYFDAQGEEDDDLSDEGAEREVEDWPGPFSTAMKIIRDREDKVNLQLDASVSNKTQSEPLMWVPKRDKGFSRQKLLIPSLQELCMKFLAKNADAITSLDYVPDALKHKLCQLLCDSRRINVHVLDLLVRGSPTEIRLPDCSWFTEDQFTESFKSCDTRNLMVLQLDQSGRCMPDYILLSTLARSSNSLPVLTSLSLIGACRLSDVGLQALVSAAPMLKSINLSQCSLLSSSSIDALADSLGLILRELYINDCQSIDAMLILPALKKLENLEILSLAGIQSVRDRFMREFVTARGHNLKELILTDCWKLTDSSVKVIAESCPGLRVLDLVNVCKLTDTALGFLANGCRIMEKFKLCRNAFSDEAVAAFLETAGEFLKELSLNNVKKVGHNTALSLTKRSRKLHTLDLSWCRNITDNALGYIVDNCVSLRVLKVFGCSQITSVFLDGHLNPNVKIIGLKASPVLDHLKIPDHLESP